MRQVEIPCLVYGELWVVDEVKTMPLAARPHSPAWLVVWQYARLGNTTQQQSFTCLAHGFALGPYPTLSQINFRYLISDLNFWKPEDFQVLDTTVLDCLQ